MARIAAPFGIKGWVKLQVFTEFADSLDEFPVWYLQGPQGWQEIEVEDYAINAKGVVAKLKGFEDRSAAEKLGKREVAVPREWLGDAGENEFFWVDLIGSEVVNTAGQKLGRITTLMETGANDVLVVQQTTEMGVEEQMLIPFVGDVIVKVDRDAKQVTVDWSGEYA